MGSRVDGSREALLDGLMGILVDPGKADEVCRGIVSTLSQRKRVPVDLARFSTAAFVRTTASITRDILALG
jgi:hypothetical protein